MIGRPLIALATVWFGCGGAAGPGPQGADGLPASCDQAAGAVLESMRRDDPELAGTDPATVWFHTLDRLVHRRCELDRWSAQARACTTIGCWSSELLPWQQAGVRAVVSFALTRGFQVEAGTGHSSRPAHQVRDLPASAAAIAQLAICEPPGCRLPDATCDAAVARMIDDLLRSPASPDDAARSQRIPAFQASLHHLLYDQCASGVALSGHDIGAWSAGARACFAASGIVEACTDRLTEPQRDSGEFLIAPWFDALRAGDPPR